MEECSWKESVNISIHRSKSALPEQIEQYVVKPASRKSRQRIARSGKRFCLFYCTQQSSVNVSPAKDVFVQKMQTITANRVWSSTKSGTALPWLTPATFVSISVSVPEVESRISSMSGVSRGGKNRLLRSPTNRTELHYCYRCSKMKVAIKVQKLPQIESPSLCILQIMLL